MILEMGFSVNAAKKALHFCRGDAARAVEWIMVRVGTPDLDEEFDPNYDPSDSLVDSIRDMAPNLEERLIGRIAKLGGTNGERFGALRSVGHSTEFRLWYEDFWLLRVTMCMGHK